MLIRELKLWAQTWRQRAVSAAEAVRTWYLQRTCPHLFQAALVQNKTGRVCKICDLAQELSREDFYAEFGERYQALLYREPLPSAVIGDSKPTQESSLLH